MAMTLLPHYETSDVRIEKIVVGPFENNVFVLRSKDFVIPDDDVIEVGDLRLRTIHTPGHTPGSICFLVEGAPVLFSGDTLFQGGPGATGRSFSSFDTIIDSIRHRLLTLPGNTTVRTGHGLDTTIATERPHLDEWVARGW